MNIQETYMYRCLQLAALGAGQVAPNPMVGSVLVYNNIIIGEGYHQQYGQAHAEVNCLNSVAEKNKGFISNSTLYVSLEPCAHYGKTPPCADLIIKNNIKTVIIGCRDSYDEVDGKGIQKLKSAGITVTSGVLEKESLELNRRFFTFHTQKRPYIILKWAQTENLKIAAADFSAVKISNDTSNRLVHKWRSEEAAILVGFNTALLDNPSLTNRLWSGKNPVRLVIDRHLKLPVSHHLFNKKIKTIVFNEHRQSAEDGLLYYKLEAAKNLIPSLLKALFELGIQSVLVEGGAGLLQSFINNNYWDEAKVISNHNLKIEDGVNAPQLRNNNIISKENYTKDLISTYQNIQHK